MQVAACPNRQNPYHTCVAYCEKHWGQRRFVPAAEMLKKVAYLHRRYPIPPGWMLVADPLTYAWAASSSCALLEELHFALG